MLQLCSNSHRRATVVLSLLDAQYCHAHCGRSWRESNIYYINKQTSEKLSIVFAPLVILLITRWLPSWLSSSQCTKLARLWKNDQINVYVIMRLNEQHVHFRFTDEVIDVVFQLFNYLDIYNVLKYC